MLNLQLMFRAWESTCALLQQHLISVLSETYQLFPFCSCCLSAHAVLQVWRAFIKLQWHTHFHQKVRLKYLMAHWHVCMALSFHLKILRKFSINLLSIYRTTLHELEESFEKILYCKTTLIFMCSAPSGGPELSWHVALSDVFGILTWPASRAGFMFHVLYCNTLIWLGLGQYSNDFNIQTNTTYSIRIDLSRNFRKFRNIRNEHKNVISPHAISCKDAYTSVEGG